jgi:hypothetical protein
LGWACAREKKEKRKRACWKEKEKAGKEKKRGKNG